MLRLAVWGLPPPAIARAGRTTKTDLLGTGRFSGGSDGIRTHGDKGLSGASCLCFLRGLLLQTMTA